MSKEEQNQVDIAVIKERVHQNTDDIKLILGNHLPHIQEKLNSIDKRLAYYSGGLAVLMIVLEVALKLLK